MGRHPSRVRKLGHALLLIPTLAFLGIAQSISPAQAPIAGTPRSHSPMIDFGDTGPVSEDRRNEALNADRHKSLVSDAAKLLRLAQQLKEEVEASPSQTLTPQEVRRLSDIEKLAKNVKEKMARSFGIGPVFREPPAFPRNGADRFP
jgi:hypothetical protein